MLNLLLEKWNCPDYHKRKHYCLVEINSNMTPAIQFLFNHKFGVMIFSFELVLNLDLNLIRYLQKFHFNSIELQYLAENQVRDIICCLVYKD